MKRAAVVAGLAIGAVHASAVVALLAAVEPAWRPATGERAPLGVWLIPMAPIAADHVSGVQGVAGDSLCTRWVEIDARGAFHDVGRSSRAVLRSPFAGSDGGLPRIGVPCRPQTFPPMQTEPEQAPRPRTDPGPRVPDVVLI